jgi:hypothetical protein
MLNKVGHPTKLSSLVASPNPYKVAHGNGMGVGERFNKNPKALIGNGCN